MLGESRGQNRQARSAGASRALSELSEADCLDYVAEILDAWLERRGARAPYPG